MRKKSNLSDFRRPSSLSATGSVDFESCLLPPGAVGRLVSRSKLPVFSRHVAQQVTTLPRIQRWRELGGGKADPRVITPSNLVVFEDEECSTMLVAYKSNLVTPKEAKDFGEWAGKLHEFGKYVKRSPKKQPLKDKHGRQNGMKMAGMGMPLVWQRKGSPVVCRWGSSTVPVWKCSVVEFPAVTKIEAHRRVMKLVGAKYKPYRPGLGPEAAERCDMLDEFAVELVGALDRSWRMLLLKGLKDAYGGIEGVLMAGGRVPFTSMATTRDYVSSRHLNECDVNNTAVIVWLKEGEGRMPPGGNFVLSDWGIELETSPGAGLLFDSTKVFLHSLAADSADPKYACRMAIGMYLSKTVLDGYDKEVAVRKRRKMEPEEAAIVANLKK